jgi:hypothetical protein
MTFTPDVRACGAAQEVAMNPLTLQESDGRQQQMVIACVVRRNIVSGLS